MEQHFFSSTRNYELLQMMRQGGGQIFNVLDNCSKDFLHILFIEGEKQIHQEHVFNSSGKVSFWIIGQFSPKNASHSGGGEGRNLKKINFLDNWSKDFLHILHDVAGQLVDQ